METKRTPHELIFAVECSVTDQALWEAISDIVEDVLDSVSLAWNESGLHRQAIQDDFNGAVTTARDYFGNTYL